MSVQVNIEGARHCSLLSCHQLDFLPFQCDACQKAFCQEHFAYAAHGCPHAAARSVQVVLCPLCQETIRLNPDEDVNMTWERHFTSACRQAPKAKAAKKRCPVPGCKETLGLTNRFDCSRCGQTTCMKHRLQEEHPCSAVNANANPPRSAPPAIPGTVTTSSGSRAAPARGAPPGQAYTSAHRGGSAPSSASSAQMLSDDMRLARELQEQEMLEATLAASVQDGRGAGLRPESSASAALAQGSGKPKKKLSQRIKSMFACFSKAGASEPRQRLSDDRG